MEGATKFAANKRTGFVFLFKNGEWTKKKLHGIYSKRVICFCLILTSGRQWVCRAFNTSLEFNTSLASKVCSTQQRKTVHYHVDHGVRRAIGRNKEIPLVPWLCNSGFIKQATQHKNRSLLWEELRPLFNFSVSFETDLKILVMGDSIAMQIADLLQETIITDSKHNKTKDVVIRRAFGMSRSSEGVRLTAPITADGKGAVASWRMTGMFERNAQGWALPNWNRGWYLSDVEQLRQETRAMSFSMDTTRIGTKNKADGGDYDVLVFRVPSPTWIPFASITHESLTETIELAHELFGITKVVLVTMHYVSNVLNDTMWLEMQKYNRFLNEFAFNWKKRNVNSTVDSVYVFEHGLLEDALAKWNARMLKFDTRNESYTSEKLNGGAPHYKQTIAHVCAERVYQNASYCRANSVTDDGTHICLNIVGQRILAGLACIFQCAFTHCNSRHAKGKKNNAGFSAWDCATGCNNHYMSLNGSPTSDTVPMQQTNNSLN